MLQFKTEEEFLKILSRFLDCDVKRGVVGTFFRDPSQKYSGQLNPSERTFWFTRHTVRSSTSINFKGLYRISEQNIEVIITAKGGLMALIMSSAAICTIFLTGQDPIWQMALGIFILASAFYMLLCWLPFNYGISEAEEEFKHYFFRQIKSIEDATPKKFRF